MDRLVGKGVVTVLTMVPGEDKELDSPTQNVNAARNSVSVGH